MQSFMIVSIGSHSFDHSLFIILFNNGLQVTIVGHVPLLALFLRYLFQTFNVIGLNAIWAMSNIGWLAFNSS